MKHFLSFLMSVCMIALISCNHPQQGTGSTIHRADTVIIKCIRLTVKAVDDKGNICKNCQAIFYIPGTTISHDLGMLPAEKSINSTNMNSFIDIKGDGFETYKSLDKGLDRDTTIVFVVNRCR